MKDFKRHLSNLCVHGGEEDYLHQNSISVPIYRSSAFTFKNTEEFPVEFRLISHEGEIKPVGALPTTKASGVVEGAMFIEIDLDQLNARKNNIVIEVYSGDKVIDKVKTSFLGPMK